MANRSGSVELSFPLGRSMKTFYAVKPVAVDQMVPLLDSLRD